MTVKQDIAVEALHIHEAYPQMSFLQVANLQTNCRRIGASIRHVVHKAKVANKEPDFTAIFARATNLFNGCGIQIAWTVTNEGLTVTFANQLKWDF